MAQNANLFARFAANWRSADPFLLTADGGTYSYADAYEQSARVARCFHQRGLVPGDRVSVQVAKPVELIWLYLGCIRGGFVFHPLNPAYTAAELAYFFADAEPALVVHDPDTCAAAGDVARQQGVVHVLTLGADGNGSFRDAYRVERPSAGVLDSAPDDIASLLYSSGTTGQPKGIPLTHGNIVTNTSTLARAWGFTRDDVLLHALPMFHTHGLFIALSCTLMTGSSVRYLPRFDVDAVLGHLPDATVMMGVPTYYTRLLDSAALDSARCRNIRLFTSGSAPLREDTFHAFAERTGHSIVERYGMTETIVLTTNPLDGERRAGTVGLPLDGVDVRIVDERGAPLPDGEIGHIQVRGPNVFREYWRKPEKTAEDFTDDGFFDTGDQGRIDDGYVSIVGRAKDLVISGGLNVYPSEVERVLNEFDGIRETAVIGVPHSDFGEAVVAVVIADGAVDEHAVRDWARERLASFKLPKRVIAVEELPRNAMGKVQKNELRDCYADLFASR